MSFRYVVKDSIIYNDSLKVSNAMQKCNGSPSKETLVLESHQDRDLKTIIDKNIDEFFTYLQKIGLYIQNRDIAIDLQNSNTTILTLKPQCFKVDFNDNFVKITAINRGDF